MADLKNILGNKKLYCVLEYTIKETWNTELIFNFKFDKKKLKRCKKAIKLSEKYLSKMKRLGFTVENAGVNIEEK